MRSLFLFILFFTVFEANASTDARKDHGKSTGEVRQAKVLTMLPQFQAGQGQEMQYTNCTDDPYEAESFAIDLGK